MLQILLNINSFPMVINLFFVYYYTSHIIYYISFVDSE